MFIVEMHRSCCDRARHTGSSLLCSFEVYEPAIHATRVAVKPPARHSPVQVSDCLQFHADPMVGVTALLRTDFPEAWLTSMCQSIATAILAHFGAFHATAKRVSQKGLRNPTEPVVQSPEKQRLDRRGNRRSRAVADELERRRTEEHWMSYKRDALWHLEVG